MKKNVFPVKLLYSLILISPILFSSCGKTTSTASFNAMDTFMTIQAYGKHSDKAIQEAKLKVKEIEKAISTTNPESDVYKMNESSLNSSISPHTLTLATYALQMAQTTGGALNPALYPITKAWGFTTGTYTVPSDSTIAQLLPLTDYTKIQLNGDRPLLPPGAALDFGALGKGYTGDQILALLQQSGITSALIDLGGNIQALGKKPDGTPWNIGIKNPWDGTVAAALKINNQAVITSGGYERFFTTQDGQQHIHIFDSTTGRPVQNGTASVTIIADTGLYGDALSTALFVMGKEKATTFWQQHQNFEMIIITEEKELYYTEGLAQNLRPISAFSSITVIHK